MKTKFYFSILLMTLPIYAMVLGQCPFDEETLFLHINNIRASIGNNGANFTKNQNGSFQVPYEGSNSPSTFFTSNLWFKGVDAAGNLKASANTYNNSPNCFYIPGPSEMYQEYDEKEAQNWNRLFEVNSEQINSHILDYAEDQVIQDTITAIFGWPGRGNPFFYDIYGFELKDRIQGLAPFNDINENGIYDPQLGEYPMVDNQTNWDKSSKSFPDVIIWSVYHTGNAPNIDPNFVYVSMEIQQTAWAFNCGDELIDNTLFIQYKMINWDVVDLYEFRTGFWFDPDLGCELDDYIGTFPELNAVYVYNSDDFDPDCSNSGYGYSAPVQSITFFGNFDIDGAYYYSNGSITGEPDFAHEYANLLDGKWKDGTPFTKGGSGYNPGSTDTVNFVFPDRPGDPQGWSMHSAGLSGSDQRILVVDNYQGLGGQDKEGLLRPGSIYSFDLAFSFFQDEELNNNELVDFARYQIEELQDLYHWGTQGCYFSNCDCSCLWPGDSDGNGLVNYLDVVDIFKNYQDMGPERNGPIAWVGSEAEDWQELYPGNRNAKYADANGDGIVNEMDLDIVKDLDGNRNECYEADMTGDPIGDELYWDFSGDKKLERHSLYQPELILDNDREIWGISYEVSFDSDILNLVFDKDKLEWEGDQTGDHVYEYKGNVDGVYRSIHFNDQKENMALKGESIKDILKLVFQCIHIPESYHQPYVEVEVNQATLYFKDGSEYKIPSKSLKLDLPDEVIITDVTERSPSLNFYPNPAGDFIHFDLDEDKTYLLSIQDVNGKKLCEQIISIANSKVDLSQIEEGYYIIKVYSENELRSSKLVIAR